MAKVVSFQNNYLTLKAKYQPKIGDSIAINGACLTVVKVTSGTFSVELSPESVKILAMENYKDEVHMEPAMMMGDRFEGHIVQGHRLFRNYKIYQTKWKFYGFSYLITK